MNPNQASLVGTGLNVAGQALAGPTGGLSLVASNLIGGFMQSIAKPETKRIVKKDVNRINPYAGKVTNQYGGNAQESEVIEKQVGGGPSAPLALLNQISGASGVAEAGSSLINSIGSKETPDTKVQKKEPVPETDFVYERAGANNDDSGMNIDSDLRFFQREESKPKPPKVDTESSLVHEGVKRPGEDIGPNQYLQSIMTQGLSQFDPFTAERMNQKAKRGGYY